jgi:hypothetical protein
MARVTGTLCLIFDLTFFEHNIMTVLQPVDDRTENRNVHQNASLIIGSAIQKSSSLQLEEGRDSRGKGNQNGTRQKSDVPKLAHRCEIIMPEG